MIKLKPYTYNKCLEIKQLFIKIKNEYINKQLKILIEQLKKKQKRKNKKLNSSAINIYDYINKYIYIYL